MHCARSSSANLRQWGASTNLSFNYSILDETAHRPWPMPEEPWMMTQTWHDLLFAHWRVGVTDARASLPQGIEIDLYEGEAWLGVVPFSMSNVAPRGVPSLPWLSAFPELNVRTYVRVGGARGVFFYSLDAANPVAVRVARALFHLPYFSAQMTVGHDGDWVRYESRRTDTKGKPAELLARYRPTGPAHRAVKGSLDEFLTERYCLFTVDRSARVCRVDIHHPPWPLQDAELEVQRNTMAEAAGFRVAAMAPLLHFARRQDIVAWPLRRLEA